MEKCLCSLLYPVSHLLGGVEGGDPNEENCAMARQGFVAL